jgi:hypothetical protein
VIKWGSPTETELGPRFRWMGIPFRRFGAVFRERRESEAGFRPEIFPWIAAKGYDPSSLAARSTRAQVFCLSPESSLASFTSKWRREIRRAPEGGIED